MRTDLLLTSALPPNSQASKQAAADSQHGTHQNTCTCTLTISNSAVWWVCYIKQLYRLYHGAKSSVQLGALF